MIGKAEIREYESAKIAAVTNPYLWFYAPHGAAESWEGGCATREEAIDEGRESYAPCSFVICEANKAMVGPFFNDGYLAENIIEELIEKSEECWGEGDQNMEAHGPTDDPARRLRDAVAGWLTEHPWKGWNFGDVRRQEEIPAEPGDPRN